MKYEWRKKEKNLYLPKAKPIIIDVPEMNYLTIVGEGNPNDEKFSLVVEALYALSYGIRMLPKKGIVPDGYFEYTVFPLEGFWDLNEVGKKIKQNDKYAEISKDNLIYKMMIRQPEFVNSNLVEEVRKMVFDKKKNSKILDIRFEAVREGKCLQMLHVGSYDNESESFALMESYCESNSLKRIDMTHKEIYLNDPRKTDSEKLKTTLRFKVENI